MSLLANKWRNPFAKTYSKQEKSIFRFLRRNDLFATLLDEELAYFTPHIYARTYAKNEVIFFRNDPSQALYLIKSGEVALNLDIEKKFELLISLKSTHNLGENSLIENTRRSYNSISLVDNTELYVIPQINIFEIFEENMMIKAKIMASLSAQYEKYSQNLFANYRSSLGFMDLGRAYYKEFSDED